MDMRTSRIAGFRPHPEFATLIQTVYECGHAYSSQLSRFQIPEDDAIRCVKCVTGMPPDVEGEEFARVCNQGLADHPVIGRLARALRYHMNLTEKRCLMEDGTRPEVEEAIYEARAVLEALGMGFDPMGAGEGMVAGGEQAAGGGYALPDLSLL